MKRLVDRPRSTSFFSWRSVCTSRKPGRQTRHPRLFSESGDRPRNIARRRRRRPPPPPAPLLPLARRPCARRPRATPRAPVRSSPDLPSLGAPHRAVRKAGSSGRTRVCALRLVRQPCPPRPPRSRSAGATASGAASTTVRARPRSRLRVATPRSRPGRPGDARPDARNVAARRRRESVQSRRPHTSVVVFFHPLTRARPSPLPPIPRALTPGRRAAVRRSSGRRLTPLAPRAVATEGPASSRAPSGDVPGGAPPPLLEPGRPPPGSPAVSPPVSQRRGGRHVGSQGRKIRRRRRDRVRRDQQCFNVEVTPP